MNQNIIPIAVVYTKGAGIKKYIKVFKNIKLVDKIIDVKSKLLPDNAVIVDIGQGSDFEERYKKKHKI
ncbi:hypothetical protein N9H35_00305 [bacterium]|nr:hypothetical protein [bacterium]